MTTYYLICTISFWDNAWTLFDREIQRLRLGWPVNKVRYMFTPASVSYIQGGTHTISTSDDVWKQRIKSQLEELLVHENFIDYKLLIREKKTDLEKEKKEKKTEDAKLD